MRTIAVAVVSALVFAAVEGRAETTVARIVCPAETKAKVSLPDKIGSDPTFSRVSPDDRWIQFAFDQMTQNEQVIVCRYVRRLGSSTTHAKMYSYTAKRKIVRCKQVDPRTLDCEVKE